jgi:hypothetical protein
MKVHVTAMLATAAFVISSSPAHAEKVQNGLGLNGLGLNGLGLNGLGLNGLGLNGVDANGQKAAPTETRSVMPQVARVRLPNGQVVELR